MNPAVGETVAWGSSARISERISSRDGVPVPERASTTTMPSTCIGSVLVSMCRKNASAGPTPFDVDV